MPSTYEYKKLNSAAKRSRRFVAASSFVCFFAITFLISLFGYHGSSANANNVKQASGQPLTPEQIQNGQTTIASSIQPQTTETQNTEPQGDSTRNDAQPVESSTARSNSSTQPPTTKSWAATTTNPQTTSAPNTTTQTQPPTQPPTTTSPPTTTTTVSQGS